MSQAQHTWQPIETAPKDGTRILLSTDARMGMSAYGPVPCPPTSHIGYWNPEADAWVDECGSFDGDAHHLETTGNWSVSSGWLQPNEVTHWMAIPDPPQSQVDSAQKEGRE